MHVASVWNTQMWLLSTVPAVCSSPPSCPPALLSAETPTSELYSPDDWTTDTENKIRIYKHLIQKQVHWKCSSLVSFWCQRAEYYCVIITEYFQECVILTSGCLTRGLRVCRREDTNPNYLYSKSVCNAPEVVTPELLPPVREAVKQGNKD